MTAPNNERESGKNPLNMFASKHACFRALCFYRTVLFEDEVYLKGQTYNATMETRKWLETNEDFTQVWKVQQTMLADSLYQYPPNKKS